MAKEQVQSIQAAKQAAAGSSGRERSSIQFPYNDLDDAASIAQAIHDNAGVSCTVDQLAAYMKQSITSGAFRLRLSNAAIFGLTNNERGEVHLTPLSRRLVDPSQAAAARADAFLHVPLYARIFETYKGFTLPGPAALEKFMLSVGVSSKQTDKARQAFVRSAKQAGFFAHGEDRLVRPSFGRNPGTKPIDDSSQKPADQHKPRNGGGNDGGPDDALIQALIQKLPAKGEPWDADQRVTWLLMLSMAFQIAYGPVEAIEIKMAGK